MNTTTGSTPLAGVEFQFSPKEVIAIWTIVGLAAIVAVVFAACFVAALVQSAQELHRSRQVRHAWLLPLPTLVAFLYPYVSHDWIHALQFVEAGLVWGCAIMFWAGRGWIRWTVLPAVVLMVLTAGVR
ncbi:MAG TPA: hypothetical protein VJ831_04555 [Jatrophihabitantaceae bacterium]|nr:hypothetical protein [Jatrophihabitantaceae bacterium]